MDATPDEPTSTTETTPIMWIKRYIVNIPVSLLMLAMALRLDQGVISPSSTVAFIGRRFDISPEIAIVIMFIFGFGALFAPSRWHLFASTAPLIAYAVAVFMHWRTVGAGVLPDVDAIAHVSLAIFVILWVMYGRPFPDDQLVELPGPEETGSEASVGTD